MFPIDPKAPKMNKKNKKWDFIEKLVTILSIIIAIVSLIYSSISFNLSQESYKSSNAQFEQNSKSADSQFRQISLLLKSYQDIADSSLLVTNNLLITTKQMLIQQMGSFEPNVGIINTEYILGTNEINQKLGILVTITNSGGRTAYKVVTKFVYYNKELEKLHEYTSKSIELIPNTPKTIYEDLIIPKKAQVEYYLLVKIEYYDKILDKHNQLLSVFKPSKYAATFEEIEPNIKNEILKKFNSSKQ
jgi:hypothetical protein